jgi:FdhD protein
MDPAGAASPRPDYVEETVIRLRVNDTPVAVWSGSPCDGEPLAAGWLLAHGYITGAADLRRVSAGMSHGVLSLAAEVPAERAAAGASLRQHRLERGCGLAHYLECDPPAASRARARLDVPGGFPALFQALFADGRRGVHHAALAGAAGLLPVMADVSRHNAVDRAIGAALLAGMPLERLGLVVSARISGEIALKAARAGIAWVASRSIPTSLAVRIAAAAGIPLVARATGRDAVVLP